jgi:hypothetical protein
MEWQVTTDGGLSLKVNSCDDGIPKLDLMRVVNERSGTATSCGCSLRWVPCVTLWLPCPKSRTRRRGQARGAFVVFNAAFGSQIEARQSLLQHHRALLDSFVISVLRKQAYASGAEPTSVSIMAVSA